MLNDPSKLRREFAGNAGQRAFVESVRIKEEQASGTVLRLDRVMGLFWGLMLTKCLLSTWAVGHWDMPISSFWVWLPSLVFGAVCTLLYGIKDSATSLPDNR